MKKKNITCKVKRAGKLTFYVFVLFLLNNTLSAQNETDVLRYSWTESLGSIRTTGMGGAYGSLGADLASSIVNPAGIGMYRRGDASVSMGLHSSKTTTSLGSSIVFPDTETDISATIGSIGIALTIPSVNPDWPFITLAVSHHKQAMYDQTLLLEDTEFQQSLLGVFQDLATGVHNADLNDGEYPYNASLAWYTYLLDPDGEDDYNYVTPFATDDPVNVDRRIERSGNMGETQYSVGGTFREIISLGATLGITKVNFSEESRHSETPLDPGTDLSSWTYYETVVIEGNGIVGRIGAIANISKWMRIGLAWHSPTRLKLIDSYSTSINSVWKDGDNYTESSPEGGYEYLVITPSKTIVSGSFIIGKVGILSADYETTDLSSGKLKAVDSWLSDGYDFEAENEAVESSYSRIHEVRIGLEMRIAKNWRIRSGAGISTSPFSIESGVLSDPARNKVSLGAEFRNEDWYAGFAWTRSWFEEDLYFIDPALQGEPANISRSLGMLSIGAGYRL
jgi:hypothetical protein